MAEKVVSPGVFTNELDQSFLPAAIGEIGAAIIGPTVKGPAMVPTVVSSYSEFQQIFGTTIKSGSGDDANYYSFLTSLAAQNYLKHSSKLTVVRILDGTYLPATSSIGRTGATTGVASASLVLANSGVPPSSEEVSIGGIDFMFVSGSQTEVDTQYTNTATQYYVATGSNSAASLLNLTASVKLAYPGISASISGTPAQTASFYSASSALSLASSSLGTNWAYWTKPEAPTIANTGETAFSGLVEGSSTTTFKLNTLNDGVVNNSCVGCTDAATSEGTNSVLISGSADNLRWEVSQRNLKKGTFTLLIRRGDDSVKRKQILETWNNLSLDPTANNYIERVIGSQQVSLSSDGTYLEYTGDYPQKSKYVRVSNVAKTPDYLDENGEVYGGATGQYANSGSFFPPIGSGSLGGSFGGGADGNAGPNLRASSWYGDINLGNATQVQGFNISDLTNSNGGTAYSEALGLLSNKDEYDINLLLLPGVINDGGSAIIDKAITTCEDRGDCFVIADPVGYGSSQTNAQEQAQAYDSNYAAMYWPWVQVQDNQLGRNVWVPPSVVLGGIYAFNDKVAHPWFAPAGLNRGGIDTAIQAERKLTHANRDDMYEGNLNPIATFPGQGVTVFGQKTLQKKSSALDRVNVRRLLIKVKKFIAASSRFLVFEQNNVQTRRRFLNIVNPYLEQVQSNSGLNAFRVVMDESNNTPDVVDRNILYGQIFLQPTKTAEFIVLDFTVQPTGATFPE